MMRGLPNQVVGYEQATAYRRLFARFIDGLIWVFVFLPLSGLIGAIFGLAGSDASIVGFYVALLASLIGYDSVMVHVFGKTLGKKALGLRVIDARGEKLSWTNSMVRSVVLVISGILVIFLIVATASVFGWIFLWGLGKYERFPHDALSKSFVVRESPGLPQAVPRGPTALLELERLREQGIISQEEYERKKKELGVTAEPPPPPP